MKCPSGGSIQSYIDGELNDVEMKEIEMHLFECEKCKEIYKELNSVNSFAMGKLQDYKKEFDINNIKTGNMNIEVKNKKGAFKDMKRYKKIATAACAALVLTTCVTVEPIRASVINAVSIFRAKDIKSVNISLDDVKKLEKALEDHKTDINIDKIGKVNFQGGEEKTVTMEEAKKTLPFTISVPKNIPEKNTESIVINAPSKIDFTLNVENVNQLLKSLGGKKVFPKDLDGKTFSLNMAGTLNIRYKDAANDKYINITESKVPEIIAPAEANVDEIFNALSELSVLPPEMQKQLKSMKDWKSTLYVPNVGNQLEELNIDGMKAVGSFENNNGNKSSSILILNDGVLVNINGNVDKNEMLEIAKSMR
ncbi:anti-sigma factor family protein [Clostridium aciditolerans]|uniref:Zf-HC2 domain-containing protein n=1 Tax=Clostridium aciditolerans TaxID=339861 RepID=A0A934I1W1_9CLOT|nr:zf-HC2 domain-containing protein [Clostridium aciditolerans]MBI6874510.1 zf-HC2 domain-containing protein [Clostridium aciditolerans]